MGTTNQNKINFNPDLFNNVFWHLEKAFKDNKLRYIWLYGGSSASKTYSAVQLTIVEMLGNSDHNTMVMRKISNDIRDSIFADFKGIIGDWGLTELFAIQQNYIKCVTGSYTRFRGLDDSEKVKGISRFRKVILEEVNQFDESDFKQVRKRLRGLEGQQIISIFNPIVEEHWIKKNIFDLDNWLEQETANFPITGKWKNESGNSMILKTNYLDNRYIVGPNFVDRHVIDDFERDKKFDYAIYEVYALGNWGKIITGGEFYKNFRREKHVARIIAENHPPDKLWYDSTLPLHLSFDENVNPYFPCMIFQIKGQEVRLIDEIIARNPNNTTSWMTAEIKRRYNDHQAGMFIYGDATSVKEDVKQQKGMDLFRMLINDLEMFHPHRRVATSNPNVRNRGDWINDLLIGNPKAGNIKLIIEDHCSEAIQDFYRTQEDAEGGKDKRTITDKITKKSYQPHSHCTDCTDYLLCYAFANEYKLWQTGGKATSVIFSTKKHSW